MSENLDYISIDNLSFNYGSRRAISDLSLLVKRGETLAIFGPNGAGKTSLLRLMATLATPKSGSISYFGLDPKVNPEGVRRMIGYAAHETLIYKDLSARDNLIFYGGLYRLSDPKRRASEVLSLLELEGRAGDAARRLSQGMLQRLSIGRAILHDPMVVLLDEPLSGLDQKAAQLFERIILSLKAKQKTVIFTTHDFESGFRLADSVAVMAGGRIEYRGLERPLGPEELKDIYAQAIKKGEFSR